jgi:hypothetical protein
MSVAELTQRLVAINSINPALVPGAPGEAELITFAANWLARAGVQSEVLDVDSGRPSLLCYLPGRCCCMRMPTPSASMAWTHRSPAASSVTGCTAAAPMT